MDLIGQHIDLCAAILSKPRPGLDDKFFYNSFTLLSLLLRCRLDCSIIFCEIDIFVVLQAISVVVRATDRSSNRSTHSQMGVASKTAVKRTNHRKGLAPRS